MVIRLYFLLFIVLFCLLQNSFAQDQGYLGGLVLALNKSHSAEAMASLSAYKSTLLACLMTHSGSESSCAASVNFQSTSNFDYSFSVAPKDTSQAWAMKASGKGNYTPNDAVLLTSDETGNIICSSTGKMANSC